jgi:hypothetical protein
MHPAKEKESSTEPKKLLLNPCIIKITKKQKHQSQRVFALFARMIQIKKLKAQERSSLQSLFFDCNNSKNDKRRVMQVVSLSPVIQHALRSRWRGGGRVYHGATRVWRCFVVFLFIQEGEVERRSSLWIDADHCCLLPLVAFE